MNEDLKALLLTMFGVMFAKAVDIVWDGLSERRVKKREKKTPRKPGKGSKKS